MKRRSEPPKPPETVRDEIIGLGSRSLRKNYFGKLQQHVADLARFRALLDLATDAIIVVELPNYRLVDTNRAGRALLDADGGPPEGRPLATFFSPRTWKRVERLIRPSSEPTGGAEPLVVRVGGRGGRELEIATREDTFGANRYLVLIARDVTERQRAARALVEAKQQAERVSQAKSEFLSIASHELRTPITSLQLRLEHARRTGKPAGPVLDKLLGSVRRLGVILDQILEVSRLERGDLGLKRARIDLRAVAAGVVQEFQARDGQGRIDLLAGSRALVLADAARTAQVVSSFLDNAVKFAPVDSKIEVRVWADARCAYVAVSDHGPGISEQERTRLFTPFAKLPASRTIPGLGLGLYVSRQIARMHGGDVVAGDTPGGGATLTLALPSLAGAGGARPASNSGASEPSSPPEHR